MSAEQHRSLEWWKDVAENARARTGGSDPNVTTRAMAEEALASALGSEFFDLLIEAVITVAPGHQLALHVISLLRPERVVEEALRQMRASEPSADVILWWAVLREAVTPRDVETLRAALRDVGAGRKHLIAGAALDLMTRGGLAEDVSAALEASLRESQDLDVVAVVSRALDES